MTNCGFADKDDAVGLRGMGVKYVLFSFGRMPNQSKYGLRRMPGLDSDVDVGLGRRQC